MTIQQRIIVKTDPKTAAQTDLLIETITEDPELKKAVYQQFASLCPAHTIFVTNTSTLLPSQFAESTGRPQQFAAFHFHLYVWDSNVVDIMSHEKASEETMELLTQFAKRIHQIPIILKKETKGYVFNAMAAGLNPVALSLAANGIATIEEIDRVWMLVMKGSMGPFGFLDEVGLDTVLAINKVKFQENKDNPELQQKVKRNIEFLESYVKQGKLGVKNGEGFYQYPNPRYKDADFLKD